jgi:hypothetical protein
MTTEQKDTAQQTRTWFTRFPARTLKDELWDCNICGRMVFQSDPNVREEASPSHSDFMPRIFHQVCFDSAAQMADEWGIEDCVLAALKRLLFEGGEVGFYATEEGRKAARLAEEAIAKAEAAR